MRNGINHVNSTKDLLKIAEDINNAQWDESNEISDYNASAMAEFIKNRENILVVLYEHGELCGMSFGTVLTKPYGDGGGWLYLDEIDVPLDKRRKGYGRKLLREIFSIGRRQGAREMWLGTESDNREAISFYQSLNPREKEDVIGFTF